MTTYSGVVVQLVRIPACHAGGRGFESRPFRQFFSIIVLLDINIIPTIIVIKKHSLSLYAFSDLFF